MLAPIEKQLEHLEQCWFCACHSYAVRINVLYVEYLKLRTVQLSERGAQIDRHIKNGQLSSLTECDGFSDIFRAEWDQLDQFCRRSLAAFAADPQRFLCISAEFAAFMGLYQQKLAPQITMPPDARSENYGLPRKRTVLPPLPFFCPPRAFRELFSTMLNGLIFVVEHRRPIDIESSPMNMVMLNELLFATIQLRPEYDASHQIWMDRMELFGKEQARFNQLHKLHREMGPGPFISKAMQDFLTEMLHQLECSPDDQDGMKGQSSVHGISIADIETIRSSVKRHGKGVTAAVMLTKFKGARGFKNLGLRVLEGLGEFNGFKRKPTPEVAVQVREVIEGLKLTSTERS